MCASLLIDGLLHTRFSTKRPSRLLVGDQTSPGSHGSEVLDILWAWDTFPYRELYRYDMVWHNIKWHDMITLMHLACWFSAFSRLVGVFWYCYWRRSSLACMPFFLELYIFAERSHAARLASLILALAIRGWYSTMRFQTSGYAALPLYIRCRF